MNLFYLVFAPSQYAVVFLEVIISAVGAAYAAPRKIKFPTELQKNRFFNFNLEKK